MVEGRILHFSLDIEIHIDNKAELQKQKFKSHYFNECQPKKKLKPNLKENKQKIPSENYQQKLHFNSCLNYKFPVVFL